MISTKTLCEISAALFSLACDEDTQADRFERIGYEILASHHRGQAIRLRRLRSELDDHIAAESCRKGRAAGRRALRRKVKIS